MQTVAVLNVVGLSASLLGEHTPRLKAFADRYGMQPFAPAFPAVTCTAQSSMLTGGSPGEHGIVGNGWYDRESAEVRFWKQSNHLIHGEKVWEHLRKKRHAANTYLNGMSLAGYRALFSRYFQILEETVAIPGLGAQFMTPAIREELKDYADEELFSNGVIFVLRPLARSTNGR